MCIVVPDDQASCRSILLIGHTPSPLVIGLVMPNPCPVGQAGLTALISCTVCICELPLVVVDIWLAQTRTLPGRQTFRPVFALCRLIISC